MSLLVHAFVFPPVFCAVVHRNREYLTEPLPEIPMPSNRVSKTRKYLDLHQVVLHQSSKLRATTVELFHRWYVRPQAVNVWWLTCNCLLSDFYYRSSSVYRTSDGSVVGFYSLISASNIHSIYYLPNMVSCCQMWELPVTVYAWICSRVNSCRLQPQHVLVVSSVSCENNAISSISVCFLLHFILFML